jgi:transcriptional regulator GlxA family with amidase domain
MEHLKPQDDSISTVNEPELSVGFILTPNFTLMAFTGFVEVLRHAGDTGDKSQQLLCSWKIMSVDGCPVKASCGLEVCPWSALVDPSEFDYLVVVGGQLPEGLQYDGRLIDYLRNADGNGVPLIGVCTGSFILAKAGLMDNVRASVHWFHYQDFEEYFPNAIPVTDEIFTIDNGRITCAGGASVADLAVYLVERHCGKARALKSLRQLIFDQARTSTHPQIPFLSEKVRSFEPRLRKAIFLMEQRLREPMSIQDIADQVSISERQLTRLFHHQFNQSPSSYYRSLRLDYACWLLLHTERSVSQIAYDCGFTDVSHLNKLFQAKYSLRATEWRNQKQQSI